MSRVPPHASDGQKLSGAEELEQLEELGDDAIIAQQQGAHAPKPRAQVTEEARSVVISDHPPQGSSRPPAAPPAGGKKRSERTEKTVVIRDRRALDDLRKEIEKRRPKPEATPGLWLWVAVGVAAFLVGGLVALFATREGSSTAGAVPSAEVLAPIPSAQPAATSEPPSVSIDELPIEGGKKK